MQTMREGQNNKITKQFRDSTVKKEKTNAAEQALDVLLIYICYVHRSFLSCKRNLRIKRNALK